MQTKDKWIFKVENLKIKWFLLNTWRAGDEKLLKKSWSLVRPENNQSVGKKKFDKKVLVIKEHCHHV